MALLVECEGLRSPSERGHISLEQGQARGELGRLLAGASSTSLLAGASGLLVEELLEAGSLLVPGVSGVLVNELLAASSLLVGASRSSLLGGAIGSSLLAGAIGSSLLAGVSGVLVNELLAASSLLVGASRSSLLAGASGLLVEELLEAGSLLAPGASGLLVEELLATALVLLVPFLPWKVGTNVGRGVVCLIVGKQPAGCPGGRLRPLDLQPHLRIGEGGRGQMGRR
jgi:hypothetical protein